jgi:hypothetical protein
VLRCCNLRNPETWRTVISDSFKAQLAIVGAMNAICFLRLRPLEPREKNTGLHKCSASWRCAAFLFCVIYVAKLQDFRAAAALCALWNANHVQAPTG